MTPARARAYMTGRPRDAAPGRKPWRVRAYLPSQGFPRGRVVWKDTDTGKSASRTPDDGQTLEELFDQIEKSLGRNVAVTGAAGAKARNLWALATRYYAWLASEGRDPDYIYNRRILLEKHFLREHGDRPVTKWGPELTSRVIKVARGKVGAARVEDLGVALSGLRATAHRPDEDNVRWLAPDVDPMEGVKYSKGSTRRDPEAVYIERSERPDTAAVLTAVEACRRRAERFDAIGWPEQVELAGFGGPRLSEQLGLRADDLDPETCSVRINGVWLHPKGLLPYRRPFTKTQVNRVVPVPASLFAKLSDLIPAARERQTRRRAAAAQAREAGTTYTETLHDGTTREASVADWMERENHAFLFCDPRTGWPWTQEEFNTEWRRIVRVTRTMAAAEPDRWTAWPVVLVENPDDPTAEPRKVGVPYRNLRHHTATWWNEELDMAWPLVAKFLGNSYEVCLAHYVRSSSGDEARARAALAKR